MDTTKKNIKMCEKAEKIQKLWHPQNADIYWDRKEKYQGYVLLNIGFVLKREEGNFIWLPRQNQLQEMSNMTWWDFDKRCNEIRKCALEDPLSEWEIKTKEQAGICVVMEKRFYKVWDDKKEDWFDPGL